MTDNEIIKALESEVKSAEYVDSYYCNGADLTLIKSAIDLINLQQAEIEELQIENKSLRSAANCYKLHYNEARTEAYKEFAERLNAEAQMADCFDSYSMVVGTHFINNLLTEMIDE